MYDDPYGDRYYTEEPQYREPPRRRRKIWPIGLLLVLVAAGASFAVFLITGGEEDLGEFCRVSRRVAGVNRPDAGSIGSEEATAVRRAAARLILLHERLEEVAPADVQEDVARMVDGYRQAVRSPSVPQLNAVGESEAARRVAGVVASECGQEQPG